MELKDNQVNKETELSKDKVYKEGTVVVELRPSDMEIFSANPLNSVKNRGEYKLSIAVGMPTLITGGNIEQRDAVLGRLEECSEIVEPLVLSSNEDFLHQVNREDEQTSPLDIFYKSTKGKIVERYKSLVEMNIWNEETEGLLNYIEANSLWDFESLIERMSKRLNLKKDTILRPFNTLSDGEKKKVISMMLFLNDTQLIIIKEPFQYLDLKTRNFLFEEISEAKDKAFVISSGEEKVSDNLKEVQIVSIDNKGTPFVGIVGSSRALKDWQETVENITSGWINDASSTKREIERIKSTVIEQKRDPKRLRSKDAIKTTIVLENRLNRMIEKFHDLKGFDYIDSGSNVQERLFISENPIVGRIFSINSPVTVIAGSTKIEIPQIKINFKGRDWLLITGPNGSGKSSLVKALFGLDRNYSIVSENIKVRQNNLNIGYFNPTFVLGNFRKSSAETLTDYIKRSLDHPLNESAISGYCYFWEIPYYELRDEKCSNLFERDSMFPLRLSLATIMANKPNLLILDEPSGTGFSSEDISKLQRALAEYNGSMVMISHDQRIIKGLEDRFDYHLDLYNGCLIPK